MMNEAAYGISFTEQDKTNTGIRLYWTSSYRMPQIHVSNADSLQR